MYKQVVIFVIVFVDFLCVFNGIKYNVWLKSSFILLFVSFFINVENVELFYNVLSVCLSYMFVRNGSVLIVENIMLVNIIVIRNCLYFKQKREKRNLYFMILRFVKMIYINVSKGLDYFVFNVVIVLEKNSDVQIVNYVNIVGIFYVVCSNIKLILLFYRLFVINVKMRNLRRVLFVLIVEIDV